MYIEIKVPHKIIIAGSYTVLDGSPALSLAVSPTLILELSDNPELFRLGKSSASALDSGSLPPSAKGEASGKVSAGGDKVRKRFRPLLPEAERNPFAREVLSAFEGEISREILSSLYFSTHYSGGGVQGWGLGSSAAFTAALTGALYLLTTESGTAEGSKMTDSDFLYRVLRRARESHFRAQGKKGSGLDVATSVLGGLVYGSGCHREEPKFRRTKWPEELAVVIVKAPFKADSRKLIGRYREWPLERRYSRRLIRSLGRVVRSFCSEGWEEILASLRELAEVELDWSEELNIPFYLRDVYLPLRELLFKSFGADRLAVKAHGAGGGDSFCCIFPFRELPPSELLSLLKEAGYSARLSAPQKLGIKLETAFLPK